MQKILSRVQELYNKNLTSVEKGFIDGIVEHINRNKKLTKRHFNGLSNIENRYTEKSLAKRKAWLDQWDSKKSTISSVLANYYYKKQVYLYGISYAILYNNYIPTQKEYNKMIGNKWAKKVLKSYFSEPLYPVGSLVLFRGGFYTDGYLGRFHLHQLRNALALVLGIGEVPIISACKGSKVYRVLPCGSANSIYVEERHLKKVKKSS